MTSVGLWLKKQLFQRDTMGKLKIFRRRKGQLVVSYQVVTDPCCGLSVIFCGLFSHLIGHETINIPEIFSGVHGFTGKTVSFCQIRFLFFRFLSSQFAPYYFCSTFFALRPT